MKAFGKTILGSVFPLLFAAQAHAGATNIELNCVSGSGRTKLVASVPGDFAEHKVDFSIDGAKYSWADTVDIEKDSSIDVRGEARKGTFAFDVLAFDIESQQTLQKKYFSLKQTAGTQKIRTTGNGERGTFQATVQGLDPREATEKTSPVVAVKCTYVYEI